MLIVKKAANKRILYLPHAIRQMSRPDRMISHEEVAMVIEKGKIIEDYPEDTRGHSCLMLGWGQAGRPIHVVCTPKDDYLAIITAYIPNPELWSGDYSSRRSK